MEKEIDELIRAAKRVIESEMQSFTGLGDSTVATTALDELEKAINSIDLAQARAARKSVKR